MVPTGDPQRLSELGRPERRAIVLRGIGRVVLSIILLVTLYFVLPLEGESIAVIVLTAVGGIVLLAASVWWQVGAVNRSSLPQVRAAEAVATTAVLVVVVFASTYLNIARQHPGAFSEHIDRLAALYFTMTTLTTTGFGDIVALSNPARATVMIQMVVDVAILGVAVRLLVGVARTRLRRGSPY